MGHGLMQYYAHTFGEDESRWQPLREHLRNVAELAKKFAREARPGDTSFAEAAYAAGLLHDLGKYRPEFQEYIDPRSERQASADTHHAVYGSAAAFFSNAISVAFAVAGHHSGLRDFSKLATFVSSEKYHAQAALPSLMALAKSEIALWLDAACDAEPSNRWTFEFSTRVLFSLLVDADRIDTARAERKALGLLPPPDPLALDASMLAGLLDRDREIRAGRAAPGRLKELRNRIFDACRDAGKQPQGFFSLTVPTGGGKTLSSMAFALAHARAHGLRRIIVVIPFLSIIEQNAAEYRNIFGAEQVVEHHSGTRVASFDGGEPAQAPAAELAVENWDAPIVVTTSVQFLESLLAAAPARCRKLHNIARSVVVLDEVQTLPTHMLEPVMNVFRELQKSFGTSFLFCSATQPAFRNSGNLTQGFKPSEVNEIAPEPEELFRSLTRVRYHVPEASGCVAWDALASRLISFPQVLCVVNTRQHALALWQEVRRQLGYEIAPEEGPCEGLFHLSASMCAEHRLDILGFSGGPSEENIAGRLRNGLPCRVISTQLVEAGVDLDFPVVFRAMGPLDSIVQAAGRCNREGRLPRGDFYIFRPAESGLPPGVYSTATALAEKYIGLEGIYANPHLFSNYFDELFGCVPLDHNKKGELTIQEDRYHLNFHRVAEKAAVIDDAGAQAVAVPYGYGKDRIDSVRSSRCFGRHELRGLQRFMVNLRSRDVQALMSAGALRPLLPGKIEMLVLDERCYRRNVGVLAVGRSLSDFTN